jgi:iron(III) transport system permease protein
MICKAAGIALRPRPLNTQVIILGGCSLVVLYLAALPIVTLLYGSFRSVPVMVAGGSFTLRNYITAFLDQEAYYLAWNSLQFALGSSLLAFVIGTYLAWLNERTNVPFKTAFTLMAMLPLLIPGILTTIGWVFLLSPRIGVINFILKKLFGLSSGPFNIFSIGGMIWVQAVDIYPLAFLLMSAALRNMDPALEEASMAAGSSTLATLRRITLPVMRPSMIGVLLIMFVRAIEAFEVPAVIGIPGDIYVFTSKIYLATHQYPSNQGLAGAYAVNLLIICIAGVFLYQRLTRRQEQFATVTGKGYRPRAIDLGHWKVLHLTVAALIFSIGVLTPLLVLVWASLIPYYGVPSAALFSKISLENYRFVLNYPEATKAFKNSFLLSVGSATLVMLLTSVIAWITVKSKMAGKGVLDVISFVPIAIPGIVLGVSLMWVYLILPVPIYGTIWILLVAYMTKYLPYGVRAASASMIQITPELEEASHVCGGTWQQTFRKVILPLLTPGFLAGWLYISILALRELSTSILLYSTDSIVLSVLIFDLLDQAQYNWLAALGVLMILVLMATALVAYKLGATMGIAR